MNVTRKGGSSLWQSMALVMGLVLVTSAAFADHGTTAREFLRHNSRQAEQALCRQPACQPALNALGEVLERGAVSRGLLGRVVANPFAEPYLANTFKALKKVDQMPGIGRVLERMAEGRDDASVRGPSFEVIAGAALGNKLRSVSNHIGGNEIDGLLNDGTIVEMKHVRRCQTTLANSAGQWSLDRPWSSTRHDTDTFYKFRRSSARAYKKARRQLTKRCRGGKPAMLVVPKPAYYNQQMFEDMSHNIGAPLTVVAVDPNTCRSEVVYRSSSTPRPVYSPARSTTAKNVRQTGYRAWQRRGISRGRARR